MADNFPSNVILAVAAGLSLSLLSIRKGISRYGRRISRFSPQARRVLLYSLFLGLGHAIFSLLFNLYLKQLGYNEDFIGYLSAVNGLVAGLTAIGAGMISNRLGRRRMLVMGAALEGLVLLGLTFLTARFLLLGLSAIGGLAFPLWFVSFYPFLTEHSTEEERVHLFSVVMAIWLTTGMVGTALGGKLLELYAHISHLVADSPAAYRFALSGTFFFYMLGVTALATLRDQGDGIRSEESSSSPFLSLADEALGKLVVMTLVTILIAWGAGLFFPFLNLFFKEHWSVAPGNVGLILAGAQGLGFIGTLLAPTVALRFGKVRTMTFLHLMQVPVLLGIGFLPSLWLVVPLLFARSLLKNTAGPSYDTFQMEVVPDRLRTTVSSLAGIPSGLGFNLAWAASTAVAGRLIVSYGYPITYALAAVSYLVAAIIYYLYFQRYDVVRVTELAAKFG